MTQLSTAIQIPMDQLDGQLTRNWLPLVAPRSPLVHVLELYESGQYLDSLAAGESLGNIGVLHA